LLLNSLPHPAMLVRKDRTILAANRIAREFGARIGGYCWRDFGHCQYLCAEHQQYLQAHPEGIPPGAQCTFCQADQALDTRQPANDPEIKAFERLWDTWWIPINSDTLLHFAIDITVRKQAEEQIHLLTQKLLKTQEVERQRLACDLHDSIGQDLSSLKIGLDTLFDRHPDTPRELTARISDLSGKLQGAIQAVRNLAYDLRPAMLDQLGLVPALQDLCEELTAQHGLQVDFFTAGVDDLNLDFDIRITLYRVVQEGLNNIKKHAQASVATIRLVASWPNILLRIEDNGKGFDAPPQLTVVRSGNGMGLYGMAERTALLGGKMQIESRLMQGTRISIEVPCKEDDSGNEKDHHHC
jgi:signal transduction histidine kinase